MSVSPTPGRWDRYLSGDKNALTHTPPVSTMPSTSIQDTPQSVSVVSGETMKQQGITTLGDALRNVPSITLQSSESSWMGNAPFIRGFSARTDMFLDGMRVNEPFGDIVSWDLIPQIAIANVTMVPGSNPVFGLNTLGGALPGIRRRRGARSGFTISSWARRAKAHPH